MKTKTTYSILFISLLIPVLNAHALEISASTTINTGDSRMEMRKEVKSERIEMKTENSENRVEVRANIQAKVTEMRMAIKEARTKKLDEKAKARVENRLNKIYDHLMKRVEKLVAVDAEITKRLTTRTNTSSILALQVSAQTDLAKAKLDIEATKAAAGLELNATTSKEILRNLVRTAEGSIKTAGDSFKKVVSEMKISATSTINN